MLGSQAILHTDELLQMFHAHGRWTLQVASMWHLQKKEQVSLSVILGAKGLNGAHSRNNESVSVRLLNRLR